MEGQSILYVNEFQITWLHWVTAFLAYALTLIIDLIRAQEAVGWEKWKFNWERFKRRNTLRIIAAVLSIVLLFILSTELIGTLKLLGLSDVIIILINGGSLLLSFVYGSLNWWILKRLIRKSKDKIDSHVGDNE